MNNRFEFSTESDEFGESKLYSFVKKDGRIYVSCFGAPGSYRPIFENEIFEGYIADLVNDELAELAGSSTEHELFDFVNDIPF